MIFLKCALNQNIFKNLTIELYEVSRIINNNDEKNKIIVQCHKKRLLKKIRTKFRLKNMSNQIANYLKQCKKCKLNKNNINKLFNFLTTQIIHWSNAFNHYSTLNCTTFCPIVVCY